MAVWNNIVQESRFNYYMKCARFWNGFAVV